MNIVELDQLNGHKLYRDLCSIGKFNNPDNGFWVCNSSGKTQGIVFEVKIGKDSKSSEFTLVNLVDGKLVESIIKYDEKSFFSFDRYIKDTIVATVYVDKNHYRNKLIIIEKTL